MSVSRAQRKIRLAGCAVHGQLVLELDFLAEALPSVYKVGGAQKEFKSLARVRLRKRVALRAVFVPRLLCCAEEISN